MPTGYTSFIEDGEITTGKEFLRLCSRAFGIAMEIRDEPLSVPTPINFEPDNYYKEKYERALKELKEAETLTKDEALKKMKAEYESSVENSKKLILHYKDLKEKYQKVLDEVISWTPPTDEHQGIKDFAINQINMCAKDFDRDIEYYEKNANKPFKATDEDIQNYINGLIASSFKSVSYAKESFDKENENARSKTIFMKKFIDSLESL